MRIFYETGQDNSKLIRKRKYKEVGKKVSQEETKENMFLPDIKARITVCIYILHDTLHTS